MISFLSKAQYVNSIKYQKKSIFSENKSSLNYENTSLESYTWDKIDKLAKWESLVKVGPNETKYSYFALKAGGGGEGKKNFSN